MEDNLITQNSGSASETNAPSGQDDQTETIEKKRAELLKQETEKEPEITQEQLSIGKKLLNWRTILPLVIVIVALVVVKTSVLIPIGTEKTICPNGKKREPHTRFALSGE